MPGRGVVQLQRSKAAVQGGSPTVSRVSNRVMWARQKWRGDAGKPRRPGCSRPCQRGRMICRPVRRRAAVQDWPRRARASNRTGPEPRPEKPRRAGQNRAGQQRPPKRGGRVRAHRPKGTGTWVTGKCSTRNPGVVGPGSSGTSSSHGDPGSASGNRMVGAGGSVRGRSQNCSRKRAAGIRLAPQVQPAFTGSSRAGRAGRPGRPSARPSSRATRTLQRGRPRLRRAP